MLATTVWQQGLEVGFNLSLIVFVVFGFGSSRTTDKMFVLYQFLVEVVLVGFYLLGDIRFMRNVSRYRTPKALWIAFWQDYK